MGLSEIALLSFLPVIVIPALSPLVGQVYPWTQALEFGLLWAAGGSFLFVIGFLASILFAGEYTAAVVAVTVTLGYSVVADRPFVQRYVIDVHDLMSGTGTHHFQPDVFLLVGPLPSAALSIILLIVCSSVLLAGCITQRQDF